MVNLGTVGAHRKAGESFQPCMVGGVGGAPSLPQSKLHIVVPSTEPEANILSMGPENAYLCLISCELYFLYLLNKVQMLLVFIL